MPTDVGGRRLAAADRTGGDRVQKLTDAPLLDASQVHDIVSGRRRGLPAAALRAALSLAEPFYGMGVRWRNRRYDLGRAQIHRVGARVVSVGNVTAGGVGKTPMVEWLARWFRDRGVQVALISRGYGAQSGARNDEARELEQKLPDVPHLQNPDRVAAARKAIIQMGCQVLLLDDAFQHRRIHRDLDIVLIDALAPFGYGRLLPRGLLREPLAGLARADCVALSRSDAVSQAERTSLREQIGRYAPRAAWVEAVHEPSFLISASGDRAPLDSLKGRRVGAFCGIGNPAGFRHTLESTGLQLADFRAFPDHHPYGRGEVESLVRWSAGLDNADRVLCTHKDLVKIGLAQLGPHPLQALCVAMKPVVGLEALEAMLAPLAGPRP